MGSVVLPEDWLVRLMQEDSLRSRTAARIVFCQITLQERNGHVLFLGTEHLRAAITKSAAAGHISRVIASCARCGAQAWLRDWLKSGLLCYQERVVWAAIAAEQRAIWDAAFLYHCPGPVDQNDLACLAWNIAVPE